MTGVKADFLNRAWFGLMVLSGGSAIAAEMAGAGLDRRLASVIVVVLALIKTRLILAHYLGLSGAPTWRRGFNLSLTLFCLLLLGLYLLPGLTA